ncbi:acyl-CoA thioesterase [Thiopseudomonas acetoxidans]|uniref:Acyl-CoA thioesterase n=1 Tax=Thiopseudomonas acetoxidans TaxID=3041622 RepID=A0ABT7SMY0_9GAMM|nr:acyl-CoA thioesterase [Thiopseudomonas sp. CY1220]MDM7857545.1 acyl-CoA thioesterase [Thiopseudomonas sp. CY1220]
MRKKGVIQANVTLEVPFFDVDMMDIVWHGHYVKYFEVARCALLDKINHNYTQMRDSGYGWPVIDMQLRYIKAAVFGQKITVTADLIEWQERLKINYLICDTQTGERLTRGSSIQVAIELASGEMQFVTPAVLHTAVAEAIANE